MTVNAETFATDAGEAEQAGPPRRSPWRKLLRDPQAVITATILVTFVVLGVLADVIATHGPNEASLDAYNAPPGTPGFPLGGDQSGRDILARLLHSINTSVVSALIGTSVALVIGVTAGLVGGYFGRRTRGVTEWLFSLIMTFPGLLLLIVLLPVTKGDFRATMLIFGVLLSPSVYRIVRNLVLGVKNELYVDAARVSGLNTKRILARHVLVVVRGPIIIAAAFMAGTSITLQSGLAFLGVGSTSVPSFGAMVAEGFRNLYVEPMHFVWPSLALGLMTASLVLLGNALRDALEGVRRKPAKLETGTDRAGAATAPADGAAPLPVPGADADGSSSLLVVEDLAIAYPAPDGSFREVVHGVSLHLEAGETLGLVGESGSGKTQTAFAALGVLPAEAVVTRGSIRLEGRELLGLSERELRGIRGSAIAYVPQEPMSNLNPSFTIGAQLVEGLRASTQLSRSAARERALALLGRVGIPDPQRTFDSYPHQISGGMAQRVLIAGAVASRPKVLIADEPTTALDVTVQAEILDLLRELQQELGMAVLLVTHNFGVVADICDRIAVMQTGRVVEAGETREVFRNPQHPYTRMLLNSILDETTVRQDGPSAGVPLTTEA
ncbi:dipeptide/oligopeptide/nickel ABC transporter permease/ATP-binding protein [Modestobacter roseus]|uniref:ABC-type dipeptide/oligopeptide/nickel transport system ATPase component n=1 Tax=Modestobacter roseus TaxID=1181884 RepID=A0A562IN93_9ACTN|nr:dipeptide/oligopeptide/nickel ABC transporter permease/ATP-binding protein [Modestobacter roseus]MQA33763.1 ATP-binding cassette domain-containing protein [Modestobacter roseus]TWH72054.1 ABC-type dipeptide/oligopeptide/nickel transport system ATPase component [Modestobacter roseus]